MSSSSIKRFPSFLAIATAATALTLLAGCGKSKQAAGSAAGHPPMQVSVITVQPESVTLSRELSGRTSAHRVAQVRARINGIVQKRLFTEGASVTKGQILFEIDPAPYQATLDSAQANLARAEASLASKQQQADRFKGLVSTNAISKQAYDDAIAAQLSLAAEVAAAQAAVTSAQINLDYTRVTSPIDGRIGRAEVTEGAYVQQAAATLLATVQQLNPLYIDLSQSADEVLQLKQALASGRLQDTGTGAAKLTVLLDNGDAYGHEGALEFSDVTVNPSTGTILLRGTVPNPDFDLLPGMFVRAKLEEGTKPDAILVSQSLVSRNGQGEATVMVVGADNKVEQRIIQTARTVGTRWLIGSGLKPGERIITDNLQRIRPGTIVTPTAQQ